MGDKNKPIYGDTKLLTKNIESIFLIISSYSGKNNYNKNNKNGSKVELTKYPILFLYNFTDI